jgi:hypothetical protein
MGLCPTRNFMTLENSASDQNSQSASSPSPTPRKKSRALWFFIIPAAAFMLFLCIAKKEKTIAWAHDLDTAVELAKKQHKPVMISFDSVWSDHCTYMKQFTYTDKTVIAFVEKNFVPVLIDSEKNQALVQKYHITVFPTQVILLPDSQQSVPVPGRHFPSNFIDRLTKGLAKLNLTPVL